jgi:hypothetical protein
MVIFVWLYRFFFGLLYSHRLLSARRRWRHDVAGEFFCTVMAEARELKLTSDELNRS